MLKKVFKGKTSGSVDSELKELIGKWNLTDLRLFVLNNNKAHPVTESCLIEVMKKLNSRAPQSSDYPDGKRFIETSDNDVRIKKGFDLVLSVAKSSKMTPAAIDQMLLFIENYSDVIHAFDKQHKQTYMSKLTTAVKSAILNVETKQSINQRLDFLQQST